LEGAMETTKRIGEDTGVVSNSSGDEGMSQL
jgi:hypothetical protein